MKSKSNFLLIDDEALIREGVRALIEMENFTGRIFEAPGKKQLEAVPLQDIDIALIDFRLENSNGLEVIDHLKKLSKCKFIVVTGLDGSELIMNLLKADVQAIVHKLDGYKEIRKAILRVRDNDTYFPAGALRIIQNNSHNWDTVPPVTLSFGERELLTAISTGLTTKEIAINLKMTESTTETYRLRLIKKLGVSNTAALIAYAFRNGIL